MIELKHILILLIVLIVVLVIMQVFMKKIEGVTTTTTTNVDPTETEFQIDTTPSKWLNINKMTEVIQNKYTVRNWSSHIRLIIRLGCSFQILDETTKTWKTTSFLALNIVPSTRQSCIRVFDIIQQKFTDNCRSITTYNKTYDIKSVSKEDIQKTKSFKIDINDYRTLIEQLVINFKIMNDYNLNEAIAFSNSDAFKTIEGMDPVKKGTGTNVLYDKPVDIIKNKGYIVDDDELSNLLKRFSSSGKTINDLAYYIDAMQSFEVNSEKDATLLIQFFNGRLNPNNLNYLPLENLISEYFPNYEINSISDILDKSTSNNIQPGPFTSAIERINLQNMQLFPTTSNANNSVLEKLKNIHGINIPTNGKGPTGYYMEEFFDAFNVHGVNPEIFFNQIYDTYNTLKIQNSNKQISNTLNAIKTFDERNIVNAFGRLKTALSEMNMQSLNEYITYAEILKTTFNSSSITHFWIMKKIWADFKTYYNEYLKDLLDFKQDDPIVPETLGKFFQIVEDYYDKNSTKKNGPKFFNVKISEFYLFFNALNGYKLNFSSLQIYIQQGLTCESFLTFNRTGNTEKFSTIESDVDTFSYINNQITKFLKFISSIFTGKREGLTSYPDIMILTAFNINDFSEKQLGEFEQQLIGLGVNNIDPNADTWTNITAFLTVMVKNGIQYNSFNDFTKMITNFGAKTITEWYSVMDKVASIKIRGIANITNFLNNITTFGVRYSRNFDAFIQNISKLKPNFYSGNLSPLTIFLSDMKLIGFTYETPEKTTTTNNFIFYLEKMGITLDMYSSRGQIKLQNCTALPSGFPSLFVKALYKYSNSDGTEYSHNMYDITTPNLIESVQGCNIVENIQEAYMISNNISVYNERPALISQNIQTIIAFFYKEELDDIKNKSDKYTPMENRVSLMNEVASGITKFYATNNTLENMYKIASFITVFPALTFQYISNEIHIKCNGNECQYDIYVDPKYSYSKASKIDDTFNFRKVN